MKSHTLNLKSWPNAIIMFLITFYQKVISRALPKVCRFTPTCSEYGFQAFSTYPFFKALWLTVSRISRCHPFHRGGYDPLP